MKVTIKLSDKTIEHLYPLAVNNRFTKGWGEELYKEMHRAMEAIKEAKERKKEEEKINPYFEKELLNN